MQHPSYLANCAVIITNALLFERPDGVMGCWLKKEWVESRNVWIALGWSALAALGFLVLRVRDEERMLRRVFGREWEEWHGRTARFVPGVF